jgi:hypothetical protein
MQVARCTDARSLALWRPLLHGRRRPYACYASILGEGEGVGFVAGESTGMRCVTLSLTTLGWNTIINHKVPTFFFFFPQGGLAADGVRCLLSRSDYNDDYLRLFTGRMNKCVDLGRRDVTLRYLFSLGVK